MKQFVSFVFSLSAFFSALSLFAQPAVIMSAMKAELKRTMDGLHKEKNPPYFLSYAVSEMESYTVSASFGKIVSASPGHSRILDVDIRVGDYKLDNTRQIRGGSGFESGGLSRGVNIPVGNDQAALQSAIWTETDKEYKTAIERFSKVLTNRAVKVKEEDSSADFAHSTPKQFVEPVQSLKIDTALWQERLRRLSAIFQGYEFLYTGEFYLRAEVLNKYFVNSEGGELQTSEQFVRVFAQVSTKSDDGMSLPLFRSYFAFSADRLPSEEEMAKDAAQIIALAERLRKAPLMETYSGPAILSGEASGVFFHEIFGHRIEGHRQKDARSSQTFKNLVGEKILPDFIDVVFDPTAKSLAGHDIVGYYKYDDEGVEGEKVTAVKDGIFRGFLMSRSPIDRFPISNGHGRRQPGFGVVARQSNLMVQTKTNVSFEKLKEKLREECKKQNKEYGLYFVEIQGGFTFTGRTVPNAFNVQPLVVYKIFADGRPDELVRGVDLIGTPLTTFKNIVAAADDLGIFNGVCGAESGGVPVSASSPSLLVSTIEVQKKSKSQAKPPILADPQGKRGN